MVDSDDFGFDVPPPREVLKSVTLFDEEDLAVPVKPVQLGLGMGMSFDNKAQDPAGLDSTQKQVSRRQMSPKETSPARPINTSAGRDPSQFTKYFVHMKDVLPKGPAEFLVKAFGRQEPFDEVEFAAMQRYYLTMGAPDSRELPATNRTGYARNRSNENSDPVRPHAAAAHRYASLSPEPRGVASRVGEQDDYARRFEGSGRLYQDARSQELAKVPCLIVKSLLA